MRSHKYLIRLDSIRLDLVSVTANLLRFLPSMFLQIAQQFTLTIGGWCT